MSRVEQTMGLYDIYQTKQSLVEDESTKSYLKLLRQFSDIYLDPEVTQ